MASPKALILQGILGVAGLCASGAGGIGLGLGKTFMGVQSDAPSEDDSSIIPEAGALEDIKVDANVDLGIPEECDTTCVLTAKQLRNLKFAAKEGSSIEFEGLEESDEFELLIEGSEDETNYPKGKKYILRPKTIAGTVTIKNIEEGNIVLENGKGVLIRETSSGGKLEHLLEEVNELGIPKRCESDQVTGGTKTCDLTQLQLQKLKFEARSGEKITVEGLNEGNVVTLKIEDKENDGDNYPKGKKYTLTSNVYVLIGGVKGGDILLEKGEEFVIREKKGGGKLEHLLEEVDRLGIPRRCNADQVTGGTKTCSLIQKQLKDLKFEAKEGTSISVEGWNDNSKFELEIEDKSQDLTNYPKGKKYTLKPKTGTATIRGIKDGDITIWDEQTVASRKAREEENKLRESQWVVIRETSGGGKLEKAPEEVDELGIPRDCKVSCQLTEYQLKNLKFVVGGEGITVEGIKKAKTVTLGVENRQSDTDNYPKGKKYTLTSRRSAVTIKGLEEGDITIGREEVVFREKQDERKLERAPEEIDELGIPKRCESGSKCDLTKEQLEKLKFATQDGSSSITVEGLEGNNTVELKVETPSDLTDYIKGKKYTLTAKTGTVTIRNAKDKDIVLEENKGVVFKVTKDGNKLETYLDVLGIPRKCGAEEIKRTSDTQTCYLSSEQLKDLKFENFEGKNDDVKVEGLNETEKIKLTISRSEDTNTYPDNKKYSFANTKEEDITITKGDQEIKITKQKETWFKNNEGKLAIAEIKSKIEVERERKITEIKEILKQLGLEGLQIGDLLYGSSTKRKQTSIEFKDADIEGLKKIQFKEFKGGAGGVDKLGGFWGIKVYLDWDDDANKFPKNMKFLFENPAFDTGYSFWKGNNTIKIWKKDSNTNPGNKNNTFKIEKQDNKWYLVRTSV